MKGYTLAHLLVIVALCMGVVLFFNWIHYRVEAYNVEESANRDLSKRIRALIEQRLAEEEYKRSFGDQK